MSDLEQEQEQEHNPDPDGDFPYDEVDPSKINDESQSEDLNKRYGNGT